MRHRKMYTYPNPLNSQIEAFHLRQLLVVKKKFPCQGFSLGGNRDASDERNQLYRQVVRIAALMQPRVVVMENVLNLRTMIHPVTGKPFARQIAEEMAEIGYTTRFQFFRVAGYGVPQTRRRFIFIAYRGDTLNHYTFPQPRRETTIRDFIYDLGQDTSIQLPNHDPQWGFDSYAHTETHEPFDPAEEVVPCASAAQLLKARPSAPTTRPSPPSIRPPCGAGRRAMSRLPA